MKEEIVEALGHLKQASRRLHLISDDTRRLVLLRLADQAWDQREMIIRENMKDLRRMDREDPKYDRLLLSAKRMELIVQDIRAVAGSLSPLNRLIEEKKLDNGLHLQKVSVPFGVLGIVFESRPNVTFDVFSLCFKSGNACALKGSSDAHYTNLIIVKLIKQVLDEYGIEHCVYLAPSERKGLLPILQAEDLIDAIIPRGSQGLIDYVRENSKVPVIETGAGIVHTYWDKSADLQKAKNIIRNAKTRRVSVCNALDTLLVHQDCVPDLPVIFDGLDEIHGLEIFASPKCYESLEGKYSKDLLQPAQKGHFGTEFLSMKIAVRAVEDLQEALDHIYQHSSKHSEAIIAEDGLVIERFLNEVDAAVVYSNCSTAFTDGSQFGMGAEIGISTQKLHARGPMALNELTSYKWKVMGTGQTRD